ncbi:TonB-dependent siderophore receptor [Hydrogenophaga sp. BPS33]|uniref:TonB-dependent siderophore receptor n=1 Tax=Hydrogenophaga sp. BPS33 TaxID=2651974 RepID=UPI00131FD563|nr:TonB-dependent receptor [Hydrogenophaga sp. BPS33]QHE83638.1 TonB-dependent siderophore receptor [Hydrogenophaga sp. BPS33]
MNRLSMRPLPLALVLAIAFSAPALHAQTGGGTPVQIRIAAQPLAQALNDWARQTGLQLVVQQSAVAGKNAPAISGPLSPRQALDRLLEGSGLSGRFEGRLVTIEPVPRAGEATTLGTVTVTAQAERSSTTEGSGSFAVRAVSINKGDQALKDIPQSVSVLTRTQLDEQGITDLKVAANNITGMVGAKGVGQGMVLSARGFQIDAWQYDGVPIPRNNYALGNWGIEGLVFYDRLEVLRGSSGLLQGTGSPGGAVNLVRKRGQAERTVALTARAGSWGRYGLQLDAGGPLNAEGTLRGRVVVDQANSHSFVDYVNDHTRSLYAALDVDISPDTTVGLGVSDSDSRGRPMIRGLPRYPDGQDLGLDRSTYVGAWWNRAHIKQTVLYADLDHRFNPDWKLKVSAMRMSEKNTSVHQRMHGNVAADGSGLIYANWATDFDSTKLGLDAYVNGRFQALGLRHDVTAGANYSKYTSNDMHARTFTPGGNIFDIDHDRPWQDLATIMAAGGVQTRPVYDVRQRGLYGSWRARLTEPLTAILGARVSWYDYLYRVPASNTQTVITASGEVTPYAGLVYALTPRWSAYGSVTSVFEPQSARTVAGQVLEPIVGTNHEVGIKGELMDGRLNTSLAVFRYDHKNRGVNDTASGFACDGWYCSIASGKVRSQGYEAEVSGEVARGLQMMLGYTRNTTKFLSDPVNQGKVFSTWTPKHMLRAWASYQLPGDWSRVNVGGGVTIQSHTLGYDRSFKVPGFDVWNMRVAYQVTPEVMLSMNLNNVFDKRYWIPGFAEQNGNNDFGEPRNVMFTLKYTPRW